MLRRETVTFCAFWLPYWSKWKCFKFGVDRMFRSCYFALFCEIGPSHYIWKPITDERYGLSKFHLNMLIARVQKSCVPIFVRFGENGYNAKRKVGCYSATMRLIDFF